MFFNIFKRKEKEPRIEDYSVEEYEHHPSITFLSASPDYNVYYKDKLAGQGWLIQNHKTWGDRIEIQDWEKQEYCGWVRLLGPNDYLLSKMESGKTLLIKVKDWKRAEGVSDMFFCKGKIIGYLEEK